MWYGILIGLGIAIFINTILATIYLLSDENDTVLFWYISISTPVVLISAFIFQTIKHLIKKYKLKKLSKSKKLSK